MCTMKKTVLRGMVRWLACFPVHRVQLYYASLIYDSSRTTYDMQDLVSMRWHTMSKSCLWFPSDARLGRLPSWHQDCSSGLKEGSSMLEEGFSFYEHDEKHQTL